MMDPSNVLKDAVDRLFQSTMTALNGSNDIPWHCLALIQYPILSWQFPTHAQAVYPDRWWMLQMSSSKQLTGCSRTPWQRWMVEMTHLDIILHQNDIPFLVDHCQLAHELSTPERWWILEMSWKMQLTGCSRTPWWFWLIQLTYLDIVLP